MSRRLLAQLGAGQGGPVRAVVTDVREEMVAYVAGRPYLRRELEMPAAAFHHAGSVSHQHVRNPFTLCLSTSDLACMMEHLAVAGLGLVTASASNGHVNKLARLIWTMLMLQAYEQHSWSGWKRRLLPIWRQRRRPGAGGYCCMQSPGHTCRPTAQVT